MNNTQKRISGEAIAVVVSVTLLVVSVTLIIVSAAFIRHANEDPGYGNAIYEHGGTTFAGNPISEIGGIE